MVFVNSMYNDYLPDGDNNRIIKANNIGELRDNLIQIYGDAKMIIPIYKVKNNIKTLKELRDTIRTDLVNFSIFKKC